MPQYGNEEEKTLTYDKIKIRLAIMPITKQPKNNTSNR